jgi:hypothetical protein
MSETKDTDDKLHVASYVAGEVAKRIFPIRFNCFVRGAFDLIIRVTRGGLRDLIFSFRCLSSAIESSTHHHNR